MMFFTIVYTYAEIFRYFEYILYSIWFFFTTLVSIPHQKNLKNMTSTRYVIAYVKNEIV